MRWLSLALLTLSCTRPPPGEDGVYDGDGDADTDADSDVDTDADADVIRVATWNIEFLGSPGSSEYDATVDVLRRIDADVIGINEVDAGEEAAFAALADDLGYDSVVAPSNPFGFQKNGVLSRLPVSSSEVWTSAALSGDSQANDVTRMPVSVVVEAPWGDTLAVVAQHAKSGFDDIDEFRRLVDIRRAVQATDAAGADLVVVLGDLNEDRAELASDPLLPGSFGAVPSGAPGDYWLGADLYGELTGAGFANDPFVAFVDRGLVEVEAAQLDGRVESRDSGRLIDYVFVDPALTVLAAEIYDSTDEGQPGGMDKAGQAPARETSRAASDHFPVLVDLTR